MSAAQSTGMPSQEKMEIDLGVVAALVVFFMLYRESTLKAEAAIAAAGAAPTTTAGQVAINAQNNQTAQDAITAGEVNAGTNAAYNLLADLF